MNSGIIKRAEKFLVRSIQLQLYLTLISSPILIYWGLPISVVSPLGNIIFHPLLTIFLFLSSLIFFCQILHIPYGPLTYALQKSCHAFTYLLGFGSQEWLIGFAKPPFWTLCIAPLAALLIFSCKKTCTPYRSIWCLLLLSLLLGTIMKYNCRIQPITTIAYNNAELKLLYADNQLVLIDPGILGSKISAPSWVEFTLVPQIIQMTGKTTIDQIVILQPSQLTFDSLTTLAMTCQIKKIYIPLWKGAMTKNQKRSYARFMQTIKNNNISIVRIKSMTHIELGTEKLTLSPLRQKIKTKSMEYPAWLASGTIKETPFNCHSHRAILNSSRNMHNLNTVCQ